MVFGVQYRGSGAGVHLPVRDWSSSSGPGSQSSFRSGSSIHCPASGVRISVCGQGPAMVSDIRRLGIGVAALLSGVKQHAFSVLVLV